MNNDYQKKCTGLNYWFVKLCTITVIYNNNINLFNYATQCSHMSKFNITCFNG